MVGIREKEREERKRRGPKRQKPKTLFFLLFFLPPSSRKEVYDSKNLFQEVSHISFLYKCIPSNFHLEGTCRLRRLRWVERFVPAEWSGVIAVSHGRRLTRVQQMCFLSYTEQTGGFMGFGRWDTSLEIFSKRFPRVSFSVTLLKTFRSFISNQINGTLVGQCTDEYTIRWRSSSE